MLLLFIAVPLQSLTECITHGSVRSLSNHRRESRTVLLGHVV